MSKTMKKSRFDTEDNYHSRRPLPYIDRRKAKQELRVFVSSIDDLEQEPCNYYS